MSGYRAEGQQSVSAASFGLGSRAPVVGNAELSARASHSLRNAYLDLLLLGHQFGTGELNPGLALRCHDYAANRLTRQREDLFSAGVPEIWVNEAQLAVIYYLDEMAKRHPDFGAQWNDLQLDWYSNLNGGEEFFNHLGALRANQNAPVELVEIFVRCLFLGFQGKYAPDRLSDLKFFTETVCSELRDRTGNLPPLSPHLAQIAQAQQRHPILGWPWIAALGIVLLSVIGLVLTAVLSAEARDTAQQIDDLNPGFHSKGQLAPDMNSLSPEATP